MAKQVKCIECGYLGLLVNYTGKPELLELRPQSRSDLHRWSAGKGWPVIRCLKGQDHVVTGVTDPLEPIDNVKVVEGVQILRECPYYYPFTPGYSPDNHLELAENKKQRNLLVKVSLISASIGALAAIMNIPDQNEP